jgi:hypothetical protein
VVGELFDIEEYGAGNVPREVAGVSVDHWRDAYGRKRGVDDDDGGIVQAGGQPGGRDERAHGVQFMGTRGWLEKSVSRGLKPTHC